MKKAFKLAKIKDFQDTNSVLNKTCTITNRMLMC